MKKLLIANLCACLAFSSVLFGCGKKAESAGDRGVYTVNSPDGSLAATITIDGDGGLYYSVKKGGVTALEKSELGLDIAEDDFNLTTVYNVSSRKVSGEYSNKSGKTSHVNYECNEKTIVLKGWDFYLDVVFRCYDDGYAFRYGVRRIDGKSGVMTVLGEKTSFALPENTTLWAQEYISNTPAKGECFSYEEAYDRRSAKGVKSDQFLAMPLLYKAGNSDVYSIVTESELIGSGFYGSFLQVPSDKEGQGVFRTVHTPAGCKLDDDKVEYPFSSPWRAGITGDMKTVNESELVEKLYDDAEYWKPDDYDELSDEEKAVYDYDWVDPDVVTWSWLAYGGKQSDYALHREYVDLAAQMGWKYILLDGGWNVVSDENFTAFMNYAKARNVKVIVWCDAFTTFANADRDTLIRKLEKWAAQGVAGIKIDFFDGQTTTGNEFQGEDIDAIKWYETVYRETARLKMIVNCHGSNKPTGERRIYPHVLNREGIMGNEFKQIGASTTVNEMFVRSVIGPSDFTPVVKPFGANLTGAHQMALAYMFESGSPSLGDKSKVYAEADITDYYKNIPVLRDKTVFLGGRPDYYYASAVKSGKMWYAGAINGVIEDTVTIRFDFLEEGEFEAEIFTDEADGKSVKREIRTITANDEISFHLAASGGVAIRLTAKN